MRSVMPSRTSTVSGRNLSTKLKYVVAYIVLSLHFLQYKSSGYIVLGPFLPIDTQFLQIFDLSVMQQLSIFILLLLYIYIYMNKKI